MLREVYSDLEGWVDICSIVKKPKDVPRRKSNRCSK
jgi:hypothetical protein